MPHDTGQTLNIAVVGTGISGMSAAWLLSSRHRVTVFEKADWIGGHSHTVEVPTLSGPLPVDTGFIVYNEHTYPNLTALFDELGVETEASDMSFSASVEGGRFEYAGGGVSALLAQKRNVLRPRFWSMLLDIKRFYQSVVEDAAKPANAGLTLGDYLSRNGYRPAFLRDHILPMGSCIWSSSLKDMQAYPLEAFVRFFKNHGLLELKVSNRPKWRTVTGGSREYVKKLTAPYADHIRSNAPVSQIERSDDGVVVITSDGERSEFDHVVLATHADEALSLLAEPSDAETAVLCRMRYETNTAVLHKDKSLMPKRRRAWASWNYLSEASDADEKVVSLTYWMNRLQNLDGRQDGHPEQIFVTLNPHRMPSEDKLIDSFTYEHPIFDGPALTSQQEIWSLQGTNRTWFCGAHLGHGFHEDGLQAGLAVAEALGGVRRPWQVGEESGRIYLPSKLERAA